MEIITDIEKLADVVAQPYQFITEEGLDTAEGLETINKLKEVMEADKTLLALSAPQIGIQSRIFCIRFDDGIRTFVNPIITKKSGQTILPESCVSLPGKEYIIGRPAEVTVVYYTDQFKYENNKLTGFAASLFDQMVQALDGIYPNMFGLETDITEDGRWLDATEDELKAAQNYYITTFVPKLKEVYDQAITKEENLAKQFRLLKLTEDVINNRTQIIDEEATKAVAAQNRAVNMHKKQVKKQNFKAFAEKRHK